MAVLLDTNAVIGIMAKSTELLAFLRQFDQVLVHSPAVGELYFGAYQAQRQAFNLQAIQEFLSSGVTVLPVDTETARHYGVIRDELRRVGRPTPVNDMCIAAVAWQQALPLVSRDAHFDVVPVLSRLAW